MKTWKHKAVSALDAANRLQKQIDAKRNPGVSNLPMTARRVRIADGMRREAEHLEGIQRVLRFVADMLNRGQNNPGTIQSLTTAAAVKRLVSWIQYGDLSDSSGWVAANRAKLAKMGIDNVPTLMETWEAVQGAYEDKREPTREERQRSLECELLGTKIPGFFPTPEGLADHLVVVAQLPRRGLVLEPSAGKGDLAEAILRDAPESQVVCVEHSHTLCDILRARFEHLDATNLDVLERDFTRFTCTEKFPRVVMNPPFEKGQDMEHIRLAYDLLSPGGRLVSIISPGAFFRENSREREFRAWLDRLDHEVHDLPEGSFTGAKAFRHTGVSTKALVIEKD